MSKKLKIASMTTISVLAAATIGVGTVETLRATDDGEANRIASSRAKMIQASLMDIDTPENDSITLASLEELQKKINNQINGLLVFDNTKQAYVPVELLNIAQDLKSKVQANGNYFKKDVEKYLEDHFVKPSKK